MSRGYVYVLTNEAMPGLVKIGKTGGNPASRARGLYTSGVPSKFEIVEAVVSKDCRALEARVHNLMAAARVNERREFFRVDPDVASLILRVTAHAWGDRQ